jgi:hypothetical protein
VHAIPDNCSDVATLEERLLEGAEMLQTRRIASGHLTFGGMPARIN